MGWGLTVPQIGAPLPAHEPIVKQLPEWGNTDIWSTLRLGTAIVPVHTRGPALIAMTIRRRGKVS
jgi:hypothetical protein